MDYVGPKAKTAGRHREAFGPKIVVTGAFTAQIIAAETKVPQINAAFTFEASTIDSFELTKRVAKIIKFDFGAQTTSCFAVIEGFDGLLPIKG